MSKFKHHAIGALLTLSVTTGFVMLARSSDTHAGPKMNLKGLGVQIRFFVKKGDEPAAWDGKIAVTPGKVLGITGMRFTRQDGIEGNSWKARTRRVRPAGRR